MSKRIDQLPNNVASGTCILAGEEGGTTSVQVGVNVNNGVAGLDSSANLALTTAMKGKSFSSTTNALGTVTSTATANFATAGVNTATLTSNQDCTISFTAPTFTNALVQLIITQPSSGKASQIILPATVKGTYNQPALQLNAKAAYTFFYDGTNYWIVGQPNNNISTNIDGGRSGDNYEINIDGGDST